ncbi:Alpha/Beta hydrolase protein [Lasiosphaeria miniovina]|uniref:Alpha/Beta hydrolase protein n=1 Tax=Lasiosphaeria miniovina TaxID=1954250 RepID=A0AA40A520_9PEZI|nr:Alpha/Beta hydrolase protein [Lasiosphaeria miniovina]KAK0709397.1 Alpha/Beta hydrolase protein [Lasiosphaeria miniovina]
MKGLHLLLPLASTALSWSSTGRDGAHSYPKITWTLPCANGLDVECGFLSVPIDHDHPHQGSFNLAVFRLKTNRTDSAGSLFYNTGGPGGSASAWFRAMKNGGQLWSENLLANYDIIGVDPRGMGYSNPVVCDPELFNTKPQLLDAGDGGGFAQALAFNKAFGKSCLDRTGALVEFMDSVSTIKDFELVRQALGSNKFHYYGMSYGTVLGQTYAETYPDKVGRMILDGAVDRRSVGIDTVMTEAVTYQASMQNFFDWCETDPSCSLHAQGVRSIFSNLTAKGSVLPASCPTAAPCRPQVTGEDIILTFQQALVTRDPLPALGLPGWVLLSEVLAQAALGNATFLSTPLARANRSADTARYSYYAVACQDYGTTLKTAADVRRVLNVGASLTPWNKGLCEFLDIAITCIGWPTKLTNPPRALNPVRMAKVPPMLIVNAFFDPETSAMWASGLREQIPNAVNLWRNGTGHTSYFLHGDTSKAIEDFLIDGTMPADNTVLQS